MRKPTPELIMVTPLLVVIVVSLAQTGVAIFNLIRGLFE